MHKIIFLFVSVLFCFPSAAQTPFKKDNKMYFFSSDSNGNTWLSYLDYYQDNDGQPAVIENVCIIDTLEYNALAANPIDGYLYAQYKFDPAMNGFGPKAELYRIDANCNKTLLDTVFYSRYAAFDENGIYYAEYPCAGLGCAGGSMKFFIYYYDIATQNVIKEYKLVEDDGMGGYDDWQPYGIDWLYNINDCKIYAVASTVMNSVDPNKAAIYDAPDSSLVADSTYAFGFGNGSYGSIALGADGYFYGIKSNSSGTNMNNRIRRIKWPSNEKDSLVVEYVSIDTIATSGTDMASFVSSHIENARFDTAYFQNGCNVNSILFSDSTSGFVNRWFWDFGDGTFDSIRNPIHIYTDTGYYTVKMITYPIASSCASYKPDTFEIQVYIPEPKNVELIQDTTVCAETPAQLYASGAMSYFWNPSAGLSDPTIANPVFDSLYGNNYTVIGIIDSFCSDTANVMVEIDTFTVSAASEKDTVCSGQEVEVTATGNGLFFWTPQSIFDCDTCNNTEATITNEYLPVYVTHVSEAGCYSYDTLTFYIENCYIFIPNSFSASSILNNSFSVQVEGSVQLFNLEIFDRMGALMFVSQNPDTFWDGKFRGKYLNPQVLTYRLYIEFENDNAIDTKGNITLLE